MQAAKQIHAFAAACFCFISFFSFRQDIRSKKEQEGL